MSKFFSKIFLLFLVILTSLIIFISYFGFETNRFDTLIKNKANGVNQNIQLGFQKTEIYFNPLALNLIVKLQNPKILFRSDEINLSKLDLFIPLKSFFNSGFVLKKAELAFVKNDIKDLIKITNVFLPKIISKKINKIFAKGSLEGEFIIPFEENGTIGKDYAFSGKISEALINLTKDLSIKNFTTEIHHKKEQEADNFSIIIKKGTIYDIQLRDSTVSLKRKKNKTSIKSTLLTNGKLTFLQIKEVSSLLKLNINSFKNINLVTDLKTNINFDLVKNFIVKDLTYSTQGQIKHLAAQTVEKKVINEYLPEYNSKIVLKDTSIKFNNIKSDHTIKLKGLIKSKNSFNSFEINEIYNHAKRRFSITGITDLTNSKIKVSRINYQKKYGEKSELGFDISFILNKFYNIKKLIFTANKSKIDLSGLKLNTNFEVLDFKKIEIKTFSNQVKNNDFIIKKSKTVTAFGEVFDAQPLLKSLYKNNDKKTFSKYFTSEVKINFKKTFTGTNDDVSDFSMIALVNKGSFDKLILKGNFSDNELLEISIYQIDKNKKTLQVISDRARPFIKNFDFIKGFEGGRLEYETTILKEFSTSNLKIIDFKVSEVPALAKLLTLASLQGIADTLSGEGIRFDSFEMKTKSKGNVMVIEDALAMGPAVSILFDGYIEKGKTVSLRGTLVPATRLNAIIASIPLVGDILVGNKIGEGVVGVSFKMKGSPKNIKTTVNPIKTITPRFILRAIEKIKKKKQDETK